jgi:hypothetical protein
MLLAAMLAMVLAAAVPALAQSVTNNVTQVGSGNVACVQTAIQQEFGKVQISQYGDNINIQNISQECNISVTEVETVIAAATASATATASASATATATATASATSAPAAVQYQYQYQYAAPTASAAAELPPTGGSSLIALGAGVLLVAGGLLARRIVR